MLGREPLEGFPVTASQIGQRTGQDVLHRFGDETEPAVEQARATERGLEPVAQQPPRY